MTRPADLQAPGGGVRVGVDEWVARSGERNERYSGRFGGARRQVDRLGWWSRLSIAVAVVALVPLMTSSDYTLRVGINTLLLATLAIGLNVVVGWAGLLDLGYVAFYGIGAYGYAMLSSDQFGSGIHLPSLVSIPTIVLLAALAGLLLGFTSRRLLGDYLAIVTLFFGQMFVEAVTTLPPDVAGGPNGVVGADPISVLGFEATTTRDYFYLLLVIATLVTAALRLLDTARIGRAWRAVREDPLAAAAMTIPVNRVRLLAFMFGAGIAALAGTIFGAFQAGAYPTDFAMPVLILVYAALILGGSGSLAGAALGAVVLSVTLELLRTPADARLIFYGGILLLLVARLRPWRLLAGMLAAIVAFGFAVHALVEAISPSAVAGQVAGSSWFDDFLNAWLVLPVDAKTAGNWGFVVLVVALIALVQMSRRWRLLLLAPTIYLAAFVWETRLSVEPSVTRQLLLGALLVVMMSARPQGLLGTTQVEVVR